MTKRDKNFRMSKQTKIGLAQHSPPYRGIYKNLMIAAEIASSIAPKSDKKKKETAEKEE
jgi:hypothetical protein